MTLLGSTGSIGVNTLEICRRFQIPVRALVAGNNLELLQEQIDEFQPDLVAIADGLHLGLYRFDPYKTERDEPEPKDVERFPLIHPRAKDPDARAEALRVAAAAAEGTYNWANGKYDANRADFSEAFIAFCLRDNYSVFDGCDGADYDYDELTAA